MPPTLPEVWIVVPSYNEESRLDVRAFKRYLSGQTGVGILFVDDGSTDRTAAIIEDLCRETQGCCELLRLDRNRGKAEAVRRGVLTALGKRPAFVGYWDADLATPLETIDEFLVVARAQPAVQIVMGARVQLLGRRIERRALRHYMGRLFATCAAICLGLKVYDTQCGAKLLRATPQLSRLFDQPFCSRWIFDVELLARYLTTLGREHPDQACRGIYELPLQEWREVGQSKVRLRDVLRAFRELWMIARKYRLTSRRGLG